MPVVRTYARASGRTVTWLPKFLGCIDNKDNQCSAIKALSTMDCDIHYRDLKSRYLRKTENGASSVSPSSTSITSLVLKKISKLINNSKRENKRICREFLNLIIHSYTLFKQYLIKAHITIKDSNIQTKSYTSLFPTKCTTYLIYAICRTFWNGYDFHSKPCTFPRKFNNNISLFGINLQVKLNNLPRYYFCPNIRHHTAFPKKYYVNLLWSSFIFVGKMFR